MQKRGHHELSYKIFCLTVPKNFVGEWCFRKFRVSQNFMHKKGISLNSVKKSLSHSADKIRTRTLLCFERILVSKSFKQRRGEASRFCRSFFYLTGPKKLRQRTILFQKISGREKYLMDERGGGITFFRRKFLVSQCRKILWASLQCFRKLGVSKNFMHNRGITVFLRNFFVSVPKNFVKEPFSVSLISGIKKC